MSYIRFFIIGILFLTSLVNYGKSCDVITLAGDSSEYYLTKGINYFKGNDYLRAKECLTKSLFFDNKNVQALRYRGWCYIQIKEYNNAILDVDRICVIDSIGVPDIYLIRGMAKMYLGNNKESIVDLNKYIKMDPKSSLAYKLRSNIYTEFKEYEKAIADLTLAIAFSNRTTFTAILYYLRGKLYLNINKLNEARIDFQTSIQLNPQSSDGYRGMAMLDSQNKNYADALREINKAIELENTEEGLKSSCYIKTKILYDSEDYGSCIKACDLYIQFDSTVAYVYKIRAISTYMVYGAMDKSIQDLDKALSIAADDYICYYYKGSIYKDQGKYNLAISAFTKAISLNKEYALAYGVRSITYLKLNNYTSAEADINFAIKLDSTNYLIVELRGEFYLETGEFDKSIKDFNYVLKKKPTYIDAYISISKALLNLEKYIDGLNNVDTYLAKGGKLTSEVKYIRAILNMNLGNIQYAEKELDELIRIGYETGMCYLYTGICYEAEKQYSKALWYFQNAEKNGVGAFSPLLYESKGYVLEKMNNYQGAIVEFTKLINVSPKYGKGYLSRGEARMELKQYTEAIKDLKNAVNYSLDNMQSEKAVNVMSMAYIFTDNLNEALNVLNSFSFTSSEGKTQAGVMKIIILTAKMDYKKAIDECNQLLKINNSNPLFLKYRGLLEITQQNYAAAVDDFIKIVELYPNEPNAYSVLSSAMSTNAILYEKSLINNLVLYKDTTTNTLTINLLLDNTHTVILLDELTKELHAKSLLKDKKYSSYLLLAEFNKALSKDSKKTLDEYNKAIAENTSLGIGYYLRGVFKKECMQESDQACVDIQRAKSLGIHTDMCQ